MATAGRPRATLSIVKIPSSTISLNDEMFVKTRPDVHEMSAKAALTSGAYSL
jgi:hypothetical protein